MSLDPTDEGHNDDRRPPKPRRSLRPLLVAAAVIAVVGLVGAIALTRHGSQDNIGVGTGPGGSQDQRPENILGRVWLLTSFTVDGAPVGPDATETGGDEPAGAAVTLDLSDEGSVSFTGCNGGTGGGRVDGARLVVDGDWASTLMACGGPDGEARMALDEAMAHFLQSDPTIQLLGNELTLRSGEDIATFADRDADPDGAIDPTPDSGSACSVNLRAGPGADPVEQEVQPGPSDPPVMDSSSATTSSDDGVWHLELEQQRVEIHVPGTMVIDLVGERTEEIELPGRGPATVWFTDDWVQVRSFPGTRERDVCASFDVTVTGGTEQQNRDLAVGLAERLRLSEK